MSGPGGAGPSADQEIEALLARWVTAGDGLPIVPPTAGAVAEMVGDRWPPGATVPAPMPRALPVPVRQIAVCAVMAGCRPSALPLLVAALDALADPAFNSLGVVTTTGNAAVGMVVGGPAAAQAGVNGAGNCLGPTPSENGPVGRALATCVRLLVGAVPGELDVATLGQPAKFGLCFAEAGLPPGWPPLHRHRGTGAESAVTVFSCSGLMEVADLWAHSGDELVDSMAAALSCPFALGVDADHVHYLFVVPPEWAGMLDRDGWDRDRIGAHLAERATVPVESVPPHLRRPFLHLGEGAGSEATLRPARSPDRFLLAVAGGIGGKAALLLPWHGGSQPVTVAVEVGPASA